MDIVGPLSLVVKLVSFTMAKVQQEIHTCKFMVQKAENPNFYYISSFETALFRKNCMFFLVLHILEMRFLEL